MMGNPTGAGLTAGAARPQSGRAPQTPPERVGQLPDSLDHLVTGESEAAEQISVAVTPISPTSAADASIAPAATNARPVAKPRQSSGDPQATDGQPRPSAGKPKPRSNSLRVLRGLGDEQLTALVVSGSESAFAVIYDRYMPGLLRYCRRILGSTEDAEDAAQASMVRAMSALGQRPPRRLRPWLYRIAHNESISLARKHVHNEPAAAEDRPDPNADPAQAAATRARLAQLLSDLHSLPGRQRDALVMRELCGRSYADVAAELGTSERAAQQTVFEARLSLNQFSEGRDLDCLDVQRLISDCDHGRLRTRRIRAHLRACDCCATFERDLYARRRDFALLLPGISASAVPKILGLAGGGAPHAVLRLLRAPVPPDGLRAVAATAVAAVLGATGLGLHAFTHPAPPRVKTSTATTVRFASPASRETASTVAATGGSPAASRPHGRRHGHRRPGATEGGQTRVPVAIAPGTGVAASGSAPTQTTSSHAGGGQHTPAGSGRQPGLPVTAPGADNAVKTVQQAASDVGKTAAGAVGNVTGAVQNTVKSTGDAVSQTVTGTSDTVKSTTGAVGGAVKQLTDALR